MKSLIQAAMEGASPTGGNGGVDLSATRTGPNGLRS